MVLPLYMGGDREYADSEKPVGDHSASRIERRESVVTLADAGGLHS